MGSDHSFRPRSGLRDFVNIQGRGIACQNCSRFAGAVQVGEYALLQRHAFENRFHHHVHTGEGIIGESWRDQLQTFVHERLRETSALHGTGIVFADLLHAEVERRLIHVLEQ